MWCPRQLRGCGHRDALVSPRGGDSAPRVPLPAAQSQARGKEQGWETETKAGMDPPWLTAPGVVGTPLRDGRGARMGEFAQGGGSRAGIWFFIEAKRPSKALICLCRGLSASPGAPGAFDPLLAEQTGIWGFKAVLRDPR